ncbi:MAG: hypothetical protein PWQ22_925 [Archaeoglobaceae archaeon]|nr:hypothetical protein [Archaeoglobaceae archaeon]MDK2876515.1 hypothetical protein [Archaeoglobaceae archaeon]
MRGVIFTNKELDLEGLDIKEVYVIFAKGAKSSITVSEKGEMLNLALSKMPIIKRAEELIEKLEKNYDVVGMSVVFEDYEKEIDRVLEAQKPDLVIAGRYMPITDRLLESKSAILFYRGKILFDRLLYVHTDGAKTESIKEWLKKGKEILIVGIVKPMLPPETYAKRMREAEERIRKEVEELSKELNANKVVLIGSISEEVKRIAKEFDADIIILSKSVGKGVIEAVLENTEVSVLVV